MLVVLKRVLWAGQSHLGVKAYTALRPPLLVHKNNHPLCHRPLGLELAAALTTDFSCAQIAAEIERNLDVLQAAWPDAPSRHRSLHALFDHTWQSLTPPQQEAFRRLSVLRGQFTLEAAPFNVGICQPRRL
jgi:predicted ATPase